MAETIVTYAQNNKAEKYNLMTGAAKATLSRIVANLIQELVTTKGSNVFDKSYGTMFIDNLGFQVNVYKIDYFLKEEAKDLFAKYGATGISATRAWADVNTGTLNIEISVEFKDAAVESYVDFRFDGTFTENDIIEYE